MGHFTSMSSFIKNKVISIYKYVFKYVFPTRWKEYNELSFWKQRKNEQGNLSNDHYKYFYTKHFGLEDSYYNDKIVLDIGCGPRGSLEWATMTKRRIGLDTLVKEYLKLGAKQHKMEYFDSPAERIPLQDKECDVVCSFNSLDHVEDVNKTLKEIKRVTKQGGVFLLMVEINHDPTPCEPHRITPEIVKALEPEFTCDQLKVYKQNAGGLYGSIRSNQLFPNPYEVKEQAWMSARFYRIEGKCNN